MNLANLQADLWSLVPELWLVAVGLLALLADLVIPRGRKAAVGVLAMSGVLMALIPVASMIPWQARTVLFGTYAVDGFAVFFKLIAIVATVLVILSAMDAMGRQAFEGEFYVLLVFTAVGLMMMAASTDLILRSEEHTSELQSRPHLVCRLLLDK